MYRDYLTSLKNWLWPKYGNSKQLLIKYTVGFIAVSVVFGVTFIGFNSNLSADKDHVNRLISALKDDDSYKVRLQAAVFLGRSQDERAIRPLLKSLEDHHYTVRGAAAMALANLEYDPVLPRLIVMAANDEEGFVREEARRALRKFDRELVRPYAMTAYHSDDVLIRLEVIRYLAELPDASALQTIINALGDQPEIFTVARGAVMALGEKQAFAMLKEVLEHKQPEIRQGAIKVLRDIGTNKAALLIREVFEKDVEVDSVIKEAGLALRELRRYFDVKELVKIAQSKAERSQRIKAIKMLGVLGDEHAFNTLISLLNDGNQFIRGTSVMALKELGDTRALAPLQELQKKPGNQRIQPLIKGVLESLKRKSEPLR